MKLRVSCKRTFSFLLVFLCIFFVGCKNQEDNGNFSKQDQQWKPERVSSEIEPYVERTIEIIDAYLSFDISGNEADTSFEEVISRMESLGITEKDPNKHLADILTAYSITAFKYDKTSELTDTELRKRRDVLAFQIGEDVSGRSYSLKTTSRLFENAPEYLQEFNAPATDVDFFESNSISCISLTFDAINGVAPSDLSAYTNNLINILTEKHNGDTHVFLTYEYYGQPVFWLNLSIGNNTVTGWLTNRSNSNDEETPAATISSVKDIEFALAFGAEHLGNYKIP